MDSAAMLAPSSSSSSSSSPPDDASLQDMLVSLRTILGPCDHDLSDDRLLALLHAADRDPNKALDLYFQAKAAADAVVVQETNSPPTSSSPADGENGDDKEPTESETEDVLLTQRATELNELLGGNVERAVILALLRRTNNSLQRSVEVFFAEQGAAPMVSAASVNNETTAMDGEPPEVQPLPHPSLEPLTPPTPVIAADSEATQPASDTDTSLQPAMYEVTMVDRNFRWQIGNVFGRAVVQWVEPSGPAAVAGVHKSDVLLSIRGKSVTEQNCSAVVQALAGETVDVPVTMRLRRAPDQHPPPVPVQIPASEQRIENNGAAASNDPTVAPNLVEADGDVVMTAVNGEVEPTRANEVKYGKYGFQALCDAVNSMMDAVAEPRPEKKVIVDLLLRAEFDLDLAVNNYFSDARIVSDFRHVVGYDWDPANPTGCMSVEPYHATIPAGPLGLTVENILERTIVVDIKPGGAAERASVKRSSWLVALNGNPISHLTHKETLRMIETVSRPLDMQLLVIPQEEYRRLRKQLSMNIRQHKTERPVPEQDRMSFRVFQIKIHQAVLMMPKVIVVALFQHVTSESLAVLSGSDARDPFDELLPPHAETDAVLQKEAIGEEDDSKGEMCEERRFLLNLFASIHEYDDKGESIVIRTIQFLGWLAKRCVDISRWVDETHGNESSDDQAARIAQRHELLLHVVTHVLECMSIIENHATWDVMVDAFKLVIRAISDTELDETITPMIARLSVSPSPTARILPIALLSLVYPRVSIDVRVQLRGMLDRMGNDDNPLVRRAIASIIGDLVSAAGASSALWGVQLLEKATSDSHDIVRIFAVKSCMRLAQDLRGILMSAPDMTQENMKQSLHLLFCQMVPMVNTYTSDTSWQVRLEAAKSLPAFCGAFGSDYTDVIVDHFVGLVRDPTVEIRRACAEAVFELGRVLIELARQRERGTQESSHNAATKDASCPVEQVAAGVKKIELEDEEMTNASSPKVVSNEFVAAAQTKIVRSVLPVTYGLSTDLSVAVRLALAQSIGKALQLLVPGSYDDLAPIFTQMLDESQDANVRASLLEEMARYCDHSSPVIAPLLVPAIQALRTSVQWRVRVKFVQCIAAWAARHDGSVVPLEFADATLEMLLDPVHEVRAVACSTLPLLVRSVGSEWLTTKAVPKISQCLRSTFNGRVTGLMAIESLASDLKRVGKLQDVIENVVEECTSKVPNLRFRALRSLSFLVPFFDDATVTETTLEFIRPLSDVESEVDADVRDTAASTVAVLESHLGKKRDSIADGINTDSGVDLDTSNGTGGVTTNVDNQVNSNGNNEA